MYFMCFMLAFSFYRLLFVIAVVTTVRTRSTRYFCLQTYRVTANVIGDLALVGG